MLFIGCFEDSDSLTFIARYYTTKVMGEPGYHGPPVKHGPQAVKLKPKSLPQRIKTGAVTFARSFVPEHTWLKEEEITPENVAAAIVKELDSFDAQRLIKDPNVRWDKQPFSIRNVMDLTGNSGVFNDEDLFRTKQDVHSKHNLALNALAQNGFLELKDSSGEDNKDIKGYMVADEKGLREFAEQKPEQSGS